MKNEGADALRMVWRYKVCGKQISGQTISHALVSQLRDDYGTKVESVTRDGGGASTQALLNASGARKDTTEAQQQTTETITIPGKRWEQLMATIQTLRANQEAKRTEYS